MNIKAIILALIGLVAIQTLVFAKGINTQDFAAGIFLGEPTGLTARLGVAQNQSLEAKAAWSFVNNSDLTLQANYLFEFPSIVVIKGEDFPLYIGFGAETHLGNSFALNLRVPGGIIYRFKTVPLEVFLEMGLGIQIIPSTTLVGSGGLGVRYRF